MSSVRFPLLVVLAALVAGCGGAIEGLPALPRPLEGAAEPDGVLYEVGEPGRAARVHLLSAGPETVSFAGRPRVVIPVTIVVHNATGTTVSVDASAFRLAYVDTAAGRLQDPTLPPSPRAVTLESGASARIEIRYALDPGVARADVRSFGVLWSIGGADERPALTQFVLAPVQAVQVPVTGVTAFPPGGYAGCSPNDLYGYPCYGTVPGWYGTPWHDPHDSPYPVVAPAHPAIYPTVTSGWGHPHGAGHHGARHGGAGHHGAGHGRH